MVSEFNPALPRTHFHCPGKLSTSRRQVLVPSEKSFGGNVSCKSCSLKKYIYALSHTHIAPKYTHKTFMRATCCKMCERTHKVFSRRTSYCSPRCPWRRSFYALVHILALRARNGKCIYGQVSLTQ
jgi:hypothetical protein